MKRDRLFAALCAAAIVMMFGGCSKDTIPEPEPTEAEVTAATPAPAQTQANSSSVSYALYAPVLEEAIADDADGDGEVSCAVLMDFNEDGIQELLVNTMTEKQSEQHYVTQFAVYTIAGDQVVAVLGPETSRNGIFQTETDGVNRGEQYAAIVGKVNGELLFGMRYAAVGRMYEDEYGDEHQDEISGGVRLYRIVGNGSEPVFELRYEHLTDNLENSTEYEKSEPQLCWGAGFPMEDYTWWCRLDDTVITDEDQVIEILESGWIDGAVGYNPEPEYIELLTLEEMLNMVSNMK